MKAPIKTDAEFTALFNEAARMERPKVYRLMLLLSIRLGLRPMEIAGLERSWFRDDTLRIPFGHSKRKSGRSLPVSQDILDAVADLMGNRQGRVMLNAQGEPFTANGISEAMRRLYKRAGVTGSCYSGRRTLATNLIDKGVSIAIVQQVLGHTHLSTTQEYVGVTERMMREAMF
ncbi:site-specific integrase [uncultured Novosphingobium sp.]|uniref:tyrosine-type recombinase/integrase n=1 Tax=uncultured Novosphingobium sp. TaxID=292277 RepID=UPI00259121AB|nr:site-specific integrase [uncultured Novosphingobium sp.]